MCSKAIHRITAVRIVPVTDNVAMSVTGLSAALVDEAVLAWLNLVLRSFLGRGRGQLYYMTVCSVCFPERDIRRAAPSASVDPCFDDQTTFPDTPCVHGASAVLYNPPRSDHHGPGMDGLAQGHRRKFAAGRAFDIGGIGNNRTAGKGKRDQGRGGNKANASNHSSPN